MKQWYHDFIKQCPNGSMGMNDFVVVYWARQNKFSNFSEADDPYLIHLCTRYVFKKFDTNGDNRLDFEEYATGLSTIRKMRKEDKLKWVFDMIDADKSGFLTHNELMELFVSLQYYDGSETKILEICEMEAERMISMMDLNDDDHISFEEFKETALRFPVVMSLLKLL